MKGKYKKYIIFVSILTALIFTIYCTLSWHQKSSAILLGRGTIQEPYLINSEKDFFIFANDVNQGNTYMNQYVWLNADIDFSKFEGKLNQGINNFYGIFDGNGHCISNLNLESEDDIGLFLNLYGMVCNLEVESGTIKSEEHAGSITGAAKGRVLNCINKAEIEGRTVNGVAGGIHGYLYNCISIEKDEQGEKRICFSYGNGDDSEEIYQEFSEEQLREDVFLLNQYIDVLSVTHQYEHWNMWEVSDGNIHLSANFEDVLTSINTTIHINGSDVKLEGYYGKDDAWYFAIPAGAPDQILSITLEFANGITKRATMDLGIDEIVVSETGRNYHIKRVKSENVASVFINTGQDNSLRYLDFSKENALAGVIEVIDENSQISYKGRLDRFQGRGHNSWNMNKKKGYNLKLDNYVDLLGMGAAKNYVLIGGKECNSLLCYKLTQDISREIGVKYAPESRFVQVYLDDVYLGMYLLCEKIEIETNRYNIGNVAERTQKLLENDISTYPINSSDGKVWYDIPKNPEDISGGYLMELNCYGYTEEESRFHTDHDMTFTMRGARYASREQIEYLSEYWQEFEDAIFSEDGYNDKGKYYTEYIDLESFAKQWAVLELISENSIMCSIFYYKESDITGDGLIHAGYVWDVEHAFMGRSQQINTSTVQRKHMQNYWGVLYSHDDFAEAVLEEWNKMCSPAVDILLREEEKSDTEGVGSLVYYQNYYAQAAIVNETRWDSCVWQEKIDDLHHFLERKQAFLETALPLYTLGYDYYCIEDGVLYGVNYLPDTDNEVEYFILD